MGWAGTWGWEWAGVWGGYEAEGGAPEPTLIRLPARVTFVDVGDDPVAFEED